MLYQCVPCTDRGEVIRFPLDVEKCPKCGAKNKDFSGKIEMTVWTNGKAIRKYTGQDKCMNHNSVKNGGWYKAKAIITPLQEKNHEKM